jgi:hypothetical protein
MLKKISFIIIGILCSQGILKSQTSEQADSLFYKLGFSTYLSHTDRFASGFDICIDKEGYIYISGNTKDRNFPATKGAYQTELMVKDTADVFVVKFTPKGEIVFATLLGGSKREHHTAITVDEQGYIFVAGGTESPDFPITDGVFDTSFNGEGQWAGDVFITKLNPTGTDIIFSTFLGGAVEETVTGGCLKVDSKGNIIIGGVTVSKDFPLTKGTIDKDKKHHGFLSKISHDGKRLLFSTYFGESAMEMILGLDVDFEDNIYITGSTRTEGLPVTANAIRKEYIEPENGAMIDHYIAKIDATNNITYFSYFAANGYQTSKLDWIEPNKLVISGSTKEENFPVTDNALSKKGNGHQDCFVSVFNSHDMTLEYSTLFGGSEAEKVMSVSFINKDTIVIGGVTSSADFPLTESALYSEYPSCEKTFNSSFFARKKSFVSVIDIKNSKLLYSSYLGSCFLFKIYPDKSGNIGFVSESGQRAEAGSTGFPISRNAIMEPPTYTIVGQLAITEYIDNATLEGYVGKYQLREGFIISITKEGKQMKAQLSNRDPLEIFPDAKNVFYTKVGEIEFTFNMNSNGEKDSLIVLSGGREYICPKLDD